MYCIHCGEEIRDEDADFCPHCGETLTDDSSAPDSSSAAEADTSTPPKADPEKAHADPARPQPEAPTGQAAAESGEVDREAGLVGGWSPSRIGAVAGGGLAALSTMAPWVIDPTGTYSANGMATQFGTVALVGGLVVAGLAAFRWARGFGWITMLLGGVGGAGLAGLALVIQEQLSRTVTFGTVQVNGNEIPVAAVEPGIGVTILLIGGAVILLSAIVGLLRSIATAI